MEEKKGDVILAHKRLKQGEQIHPNRETHQRLRVQTNY